MIAVEAGAKVPGTPSTSTTRPHSAPINVSERLKARDRERRGRRAGLDEAVAGERQRLAARVVARLARMRGDGQPSLDFYAAPDMTTTEKGSIT